MSRYDMSEADRQFLRQEIRSALREYMDVIEEKLEDIKGLLGQRQIITCSTTAYAYAGAKPDDKEICRREATTLYDGAAVEKEEKSGSDEVVRSGETD